MRASPVLASPAAQQLAIAVAAQEGIALDPAVDAQTFVAGLRALAPPQRLRLLHAFIVLLLVFSGSQTQGSARAVFDSLALLDALAAFVVELGRTQ